MNPKIKKTEKISVVVCTMNRPAKLGRCLEAITLSAARCKIKTGYELIIIDQSTDNATSSLVIKNYPEAVYIRMDKKGISRARNLAIRNASGGILAFTDDDCIVDIDWLSNIGNNFEGNGQIDALFGWVGASFEDAPSQGKHAVVNHDFGKSYFATTEQGHKCFALMLDDCERIVDFPCLPHANLGSSNNMACRKQFFEKYGLFSTCFGAGSLGYSAEDTELQYRALVRNARLKYAPDVKVYHNNWLDNEAALKQVDRYLRGMAGVFSFYSTRLERNAWPLLIYVLRHILQAPQTCKVNPTSSPSILAIFRRTVAIISGLLYGMILRLKPINSVYPSLELYNDRP